MRKTKVLIQQRWAMNGAMLATAIAGMLTISPNALAQSSSTPNARVHPCAKGAPTGAICQTIAVPENHSKPSGKSIDLEIMVLPSSGSGKKGPPLIILPDLGGQGTTSANDYARLAVRKTNDLVLVDQRGTTPGKPNLSCEGSDTEGTLNFFAVDPLEVELARSSKEAKKCFDGYRAAGVDIDAYNSSEAANDLPIIVKALRVPKADFYGLGIGARVVLQAMRAHPAVVNSAILDSAEPPNTPSWFTPSERLATGNEGLEALYKACAAQAGCAASRGDLKAKISALRDKLNKAPLGVPVDTPEGKQTVRITGNDAVALVLQLTIEPATLPLAPSVIDAVTAGDIATLSGLLNTLFAPPPGTPEAAPGQSGLFIGQLCIDSGYREPTAADKAAMGPTNWTASSLALGAAPECLAANVKPLPASFRAPVVSSIPTLFLVGDLNPLGTPSLSKRAAATLKNSTLVTFADQTRGVLLPSSCAQKVLGSFLSSPTKVDKSCAAKLTGPKFL
jgi:pimeloyl-ACP methyl ester carboxylesterase